jgi:uncharacterized cysteine cluster protein YcgN (CxxCxxCC family)
MPSDGPWYDTLPLDRLDGTQWETLCDGCGQCCLIKVSDSNGTRSCPVACRMMDLSTGRCGDYRNRDALVPECVVLEPGNVLTPYLLPRTCAYRLRAEGKPLFDWHHLKSGDRDLVHAVGIGILGRIRHTESTMPVGELALCATEIDAWA